MRVELRAGEPFVRLELDWDNRSRDHRLRLHVPLARRAEGSHAQGQLAVVERGLDAEAGPVGETPIPTFPAERFVDAGGAGVLLTRTMEYEVVDAPHGPGAGAHVAAVGRLPQPQRPPLPERAGRPAAADARGPGGRASAGEPRRRPARGRLDGGPSRRPCRGVPAPRPPDTWLGGPGPASRAARRASPSPA